MRIETSPFTCRQPGTSESVAFQVDSKCDRSKESHCRPKFDALRILALLLLLLMEDVHGRLSYTSYNGAAKITGYNGPGGDIVIPSSVNGLVVGEIRSSAVYGNADLTGISIPASITNIGIGAFGFCTNLTRVTVSLGYFRPASRTINLRAGH